MAVIIKKTSDNNYQKLQKENKALRQKLSEIEKTLTAMQRVTADEVTINAPHGKQIKKLLERKTLLKNDIIESKNIEQTIRENEEKFKAIATNTPDHILIQDAELRYLCVINPQLGLTEADMIGKTDFDFLSKDDAIALTKIKRAVIKSGIPKYVELPLIAKDGSNQYFTGSYVPRKNSLGQIDGLIGYFKNTTETVLAENRLKEEKESVNAILDITGSLIVVLDKQARIVRFNKTCEHITNYKSEEVNRWNTKNITLDYLLNKL